MKRLALTIGRTIMLRRTLFTSMLCGLIAIAVQPISAQTPSLAGSWQFTLTQTSPREANPVADQIPGLATFTTDGSVIETDGSEFALTPSETTALVKASTPGHGRWWQVGENAAISYGVQYISLVLKANGTLYAWNVTTMTLQLGAPKAPGTFTGSYTTYQVIGGVTSLLSSGLVTGQNISVPNLVQ